MTRNRILSRRRLAALPTALVVGLVGTIATGCGSEDSGDPSSAVSTADDGQEFAVADVEFVTGMIPHHAQAVAMVDLAEDREVSPEVRSLMTEIKSAQAPEIRQMQGLLRDWGKPAVEVGDPTEVSGMGAMDHSGMDQSGMDHSGGMEGMSGMMSAEMFTSLERASDTEFEQLWLRMMVAHHQGAVEQATTELEQGANPEALRLARSIESSQTAEIEQMQGLLQG